MTGGDALDLQLLLRRVVRRDRAAFAALYRRTAPQLFAIAVRILQQQSDAEDVLQECFVAVWNQAETYDAQKGGVMTWLVTILRHRAIDRRRRRAHAPDWLGSEDELETLLAGSSDDADRGATRADLLACLDELEEQPRRAVLLAYAYGYTHEELAQRLAAPMGTVKSRIRRALERLKRCLE